MKSSILFFLFLMDWACIYPNRLSAQERSATARIESNSIIIGQPVRLSFRVVVPKEMSVKFPYLRGNLAEFIEIIDDPQFDSLPLNDQNHILRKQYLILSFEAGVHTIPPYNFLVTNRAGNIIDTLRTDSVFLEVKTMEIDTAQDIKAIKPPYETPFIFKEVVPLLLTILFCSIIITFITYLYIKNRKAKLRKQAIVPVVIPDPADKVALKELEKLRSERLLEQQKMKEYHSRLSDIIRNYIEQQFEFPAMESTTDQLLKEFNGELEIKQLLHDLLIVADLAKFAKYNPDLKESETSYKQAVEFIHKTKQEPVVEEQGK